MVKNLRLEKRFAVILRELGRFLIAGPLIRISRSDVASGRWGVVAGEDSGVRGCGAFGAPGMMLGPLS